ncbi:MAG: hypothetical protein RB148_12020 [Armatimonadota bacterium]|nr:hypothetical protein [Armatimonadota bacterium]
MYMVREDYRAVSAPALLCDNCARPAAWLAVAPGQVSLLCETCRDELPTWTEAARMEEECERMWESLADALLRLQEMDSPRAGGAKLVLAWVFAMLAMTAAGVGLGILWATIGS